MSPRIPESLTKLRAATREIHQTVEVYTDSDRLMGAAPDLAHYQQFLSAHFLLHHQVAGHSELTQRTKNESILDWPDCPRIAALATDLKQLKLVIDPSRYPAIPYQSAGFSLGMVYVCEGSCIGNQRVLAALRQHERFHRWNSQSFLSGSKAGFSQRWKSLLELIDQWAGGSDDSEGFTYSEIERGAIAGFDLYLDYWQALSELPARPIARQAV